MVSLLKSDATVAAGFQRGNSLRAARFLAHLLAHVNILPAVSLVKGPRVSLVKAYAPEYLPVLTGHRASRALFDMAERAPHNIYAD